jgi:hypothetical protein
MQPQLAHPSSIKNILDFPQFLPKDENALSARCFGYRRGDDTSAPEISSLVWKKGEKVSPKTIESEHAIFRRLG